MELRLYNRQTWIQTYPWWYVSFEWSIFSPWAGAGSHTGVCFKLSMGGISLMQGKIISLWLLWKLAVHGCSVSSGSNQVFYLFPFGLPERSCLMRCCMKQCSLFSKRQYALQISARNSFPAGTQSFCCVEFWIPVIAWMTWSRRIKGWFWFPPTLPPNITTNFCHFTWGQGFSWKLEKVCHLLHLENWGGSLSNVEFSLAWERCTANTSREDWDQWKERSTHDTHLHFLCICQTSWITHQLPPSGGAKKVCSGGEA